MRVGATLGSDALWVWISVVSTLGADTFDELIRNYVARYPSRSYTLNRLGAGRAEPAVTAYGYGAADLASMHNPSSVYVQGDVDDQPKMVPDSKPSAKIP